MSVLKASIRSENGILFPAEIEVQSPATITDTLGAALSGTQVALAITNIDPATRALKSCLVSMGAKDTRHLIGVLTRLAEASEAAGG